MTSTLPFPDLETPRLRLREIVESDAPALLAIHGDGASMQWFGTDPLPDLNAARELVAVFAGWRRQPNPGVRWALERKGRPGLVGTCGLFGWHRPWAKCATGYELHPRVRGQGLMQEALTAVFDWGFGHMGLNRIEAQVHPDNAASIRLVRRLGFVEEGRLREVGHWGGRYHDLGQYALLRREWHATPVRR